MKQIPQFRATPDPAHGLNRIKHIYKDITDFYWFHFDEDGRKEYLPAVYPVKSSIAEYTGQKTRQKKPLYGPCELDGELTTGGDTVMLGNNDNQIGNIKWFPSSSQWKVQIKDMNPSPSNFSGLKYVTISQAAKRGCQIINKKKGGNNDR